MENNFKDLFDYIGKLCYRLFPEAGPDDHLMKLKHEIQEAIDDPYDLLEYADCLFALFAAANKAGFNATSLLLKTYDKAYVNSQRKWEKLPDGTHQHIEE